MSEVKKVLKVSIDGKRKPYSETVTKNERGSIVDSHFEHDDEDAMLETFKDNVRDTLDTLDIKGGVFIGLTDEGPAIVGCVNGNKEAMKIAYNAGRAITRNLTLEARAEEDYERLAVNAAKFSTAFSAGCLTNLESDEKKFLVTAIDNYNKRIEEGE